MVSLLNTTDVLGGGGGTSTTTTATTSSPTSVVDVEEKKEDTMTPPAALSAMTAKQQQQKRSKYDKEEQDEDDEMCNEHNDYHDDTNDKKPSNEYVLNVAFFSFVGFLSVQAIFALIANSQAMLADCEAMAVDALTYLFNLCAERIKNRPYSPYELSLPETERRYLRELRRLYLELVPPALSVATLIGVTIVTLREAFGTLLGIEDGEDDADEDVSVTIMLLFSGANLLLDVVNVTCFARADNSFSLDVVRRENAGIREGIRESMMMASVQVEKGGGEKEREHHHHHHHANEKTRLLLDAVVRDDRDQQQQPPEHEHMVSSSALVPEHPHALINLNMCSAWTHVCADTLRSTAVLVAAFIAMFILPWVPGETADAVAAVVVSVIILGSLLPLLQGLALTAVEIYMLQNTRRRRTTTARQQEEPTVVVQV